MKPNNYVADYEVRTETCPKCHGHGFLQLNNIDEFREYVQNLNLSFGELRYFYKIYLEAGELDCDVCGGEGSIEEWV